jgi:cysteine desulfurase/selenocysteine lyase
MNRRIPIHLVKSHGGLVDVQDLRDAMNVRTGVICLSHVQFSNGFRSDLEELGNAKGGHALVVNAAQSAGAFAVDVKRMKIDALCSTGHKWMLSGYGSGFLYLSRELMAGSKPHAIGWLSLQDPFTMRNDEAHLRHDAAARAELGCPHYAGIFALGASVDLIGNIGIENVESRALELNRYLTQRLIDSGWEVLSPIRDERTRSAETLVAANNPGQLVARLARQKIIVTEKPEGIRVATDFFNNEADIDRLIEALSSKH